MTPTALQGMVATSQRKGAKILGFIIWFSVPDRPLGLARLKKEWQTAGLDASALPSDPRELFLFKRAMREQEGREVQPNGNIIETDVKDILEDGAQCVYQISRVERDKKNRVVDYPKAMRVTFMKAAQEIKFDALGGVKRKDLFPMEKAISDYFENNAKMIEGRKVRTLVRQYIKNETDEKGNTFGLSGENLRGKGGGVYFVAAKHADQVGYLEEALSNLYKDGAAYLHSVPLMSDKGAKELIRQHHVANTIRELEEAITDAGKLIRDDRKHKVRSDIAEFHWRRLRALQRRSAEYATILGEEQEDVTQMQEMLSKQLKKLAR